MGALTRDFEDAAVYLFKRAGNATEQGGIISGDNPAKYLPTDPIRLWVIQVVIIISMTQLLALVLGRIRQPRVIAEVIAGVLLGPSVLGNIKSFKANIFPDEAMPILTITSNIGLVLFLFIVGLEIDTRIIKKNIRVSAAISIAGLIVPLGLGAALGVGVYREFVEPLYPDVNFGYFLLFTAVAIGITAFPVLCRILTELKLLDTTVGVVTLSAGIGNDVIGWVLLALTVALVNASTGLTALYVLLASAGYVIFILYPGRWVYVWATKRTGSLEQGTPTAFMMTVTLLVVFISAFFTDIIGVHAIFGGFLAGLIVPHDNGFAISIVEKLEDLVTILLLPLYFTLSGLRTDLGALNDGVSWGYVVIICLVAFASKFLACGGVAKLAGFNFREAGAIGSLMSCKGLVELIVLNIGFQAHILDTKTFSMFVVHAIVLTFITTPLTLLFYPAWARVGAGTATAKDKAEGQAEAQPRRSTSDDEFKSKFAIVLDKLEQLPAAMTLSQLLQPSSGSSTTVASVDSKSNDKGSLTTTPMPSPGGGYPPITVDALRLIELTDRTSAVFKSQEAETLIHNDPVISVYRTFGYLNRLFVSATLSVVNYDEFPHAISKHAKDSESELVIIPWSRGATTAVQDDEHSHNVRNPFDGVFHKTTTQDQTSSVVYSEFIRKVFLGASSDVALFVDRGANLHYMDHTDQHLFLPFFGGPDDRLALNFLVQLCANPRVSATVVKIRKTDTQLSPTSTNEEKVLSAKIPHATVAAADTLYGAHNTETRLASDTADNLLWARYTGSSSTHPPVVASAFSRITFGEKATPTPLQDVVDLVGEEVTKLSTGTNLIVLLGRSRRLAVESHQAELQKLIAKHQIGSSVSKTLGDVGAGLVAANTTASLLILQANAA